jgi:hypothetical protein
MAQKTFTADLYPVFAAMRVARRRLAGSLRSKANIELMARQYLNAVRDYRQALQTIAASARRRAR